MPNRTETGNVLSMILIENQKKSGISVKCSHLLHHEKQQFGFPFYHFRHHFGGFGPAPVALPDISL